MQANKTEISSFDGDGLEIDGNGVLNVGFADTRTSVSDDSTQLVEATEDIDFGSNLDVTDDGDGSVTVDADTWDTRVDADGNDLVQIGELQTLDNKTKISDFEGENLSIDGNNVLNAQGSPWADGDGDSLLEATDFDGIDVETVKTSTDIDVGGAADIGKVGLSAAKGAGPQEIDERTDTTLVFGNVFRDDFNGYDETTGKYEVQQAGEYHVSTRIDWNLLDGNTVYQTKVKVNGETVAKSRNTVTAEPSESYLVSDEVSKTIYGLESGDIIKVDLFHRQDDGSREAIFGDKARTYLTIDKVG